MKSHPARHRLAWAAAALCCAGGAAQAAIVSTTVADVGDMSASDWVQQVLRDTGPTSVSLSVAAAGGNGGSFWLHEMARPLGFGDSSNVVANLFGAASWDPATQGAVEQISFALDARGLRSALVITSYYHAPRARLALERAGVARVYTARAAYRPALRDLYSVPREAIAWPWYALRSE